MRERDREEEVGMDLSEFLMLFASTQMYLAVDSSFTTGDPMQSDNPITGLTSQTPWTSIFLVICTAMLASISSKPSHRVWAIPRHSSLWRRMNKCGGALNPTQERQWLKHCRMTYPAFLYLVEELRPHMLQSTQTVREPVELELAVALVLDRLASGSSPLATGDRWGVGTSTVIKYTKLITSILASNDKLFSKYVVTPTGDRLERIMNEFLEVTGIPNICGAIDGTHIVLQKKPDRAYQPADYRTGEGEDAFYSILLQGVCDAQKVFWDVCCNSAGGMDDASHFKASSLWRRLRNNEVLAQPEIKVQGKYVQPSLVGDEKYPLASFLIRPYSTRQADTCAENAFDVQLQRGLASISTAFGLLKTSWKILSKLNVDLKFAAQTVVACCVLHNFCQLSGQPEPEHQVDCNPNHRSPALNDIDRESEIAGEHNRRTLFLNWFLQRQDHHF